MAGAVKPHYGHPYSHFTAVDAETVPNRSIRFTENGPNLRSSPQDRSGVCPGRPDLLPAKALLFVGFQEIGGGGPP
jgi:hypothetical protein